MKTGKFQALVSEMKTCIILLICILLLATLGMSEKRVLDKVDGKMYRELHRMDRMDAERRVRRNYSWLFHLSCL